MSSLDPRETRQYLAGLKLANDFEIEELRRAPLELKVRQLWALMTSAGLFEDDAARSAEFRDVRERWGRLYRAFSE